MRASPLTAYFPVARDALGRLPVDGALRIEGVDGAFAAGDVAHAMADAEHASLMSCQHAIPMGMHAGYNVVADLLGEEPVPYAQPDYVTCLDLGAAGALFTHGWDRKVSATGHQAKAIKEEITTRMIYPPRSAERRAILGAAVLRRPIGIGSMGVP
jgi:NADH:ubiquinone reductase (H+-translocating)